MSEPTTRAGQRTLDQLTPLPSAADPDDEKAQRNEKAQHGRRAVLARHILAIEAEARADALACIHPESARTSSEDVIVCTRCGSRWPNAVDALDVDALAKALAKLDPDTGQDDWQLIHVSQGDDYAKSRREWASAIAAVYRAVLAERQP